MTNVWDLHHDEAHYPNADVFDPDHYAGFTKLAPEYLTASDHNGRDHYSYGNGRRVCPGIHLGERNIFLGICKLLWAFEFKKAVDQNGNPIETDIHPSTAYSEGFIISANKFPCQIIPRSERRKETIMREFAELESVFAKYEIV